MHKNSTQIQFDSDDIRLFRTFLHGCRRVAITCHVGPDGDALGSTLAMCHVLKNMGKDARVITPDEPPHYLRVLPGARNIWAWSTMGSRAERFVESADLILCMDFNTLSRLSRLAPSVKSSTGIKVLIDHHEGPENFANLSFSYPCMAATCQLVLMMLQAAKMDNMISLEAATCLMGGILTDTGGLHYNANRPDLYSAVATLMEYGVDKDRLTRYLVDTQSAESVRLESFALAERMELFNDRHAALIVLSRDDLNAYGYKKGDTEGLVNRPLAIPGIVYSAYLRQESDFIKISMRSVGDFPVNILCARHFNGGGHLNAAGGEFYGSMEQAVQIFKDSLDENLAMISEQTLKYAERKMP